MTLLPALDGVFGDSADAIVVADEVTSWEGLAARADALATSFAGAPMVAIPGTPTLDTLIAVVAGLRWGTPVVPVPNDAGPVERGHVLCDSGAALVVGEPDWPDVDLPRVPVPAKGSFAGVAEPDPEAPAIVMYTSGTTGLPKGAIIPRRAIAAGLDGLADAWGTTPADTLAHGLPLFHVHGLILGMLGPLRAGAKLRHTGRPTAERYAGAAAAGATMFYGVPTVWSRVAADAAAARRIGDAARVIVSGSAPLPVPVFDQLVARAGHAPLERYGMTETMITLSTRFDGERRPGWVGLPIRGVESRLVGDDGAPVPHDGETVGGLQIRGTTLFSGYLGQPERTAAEYTGDGWWMTGDAAVIDAGGFHRIVGRASIDIIKCGGYKVGAGEVETALLGHPAVSEVAVLGLPDIDLGERIVAFVVAADAVPESTLIDHVALSLSAHKRPREIRFVESLPRNAMGKVQKTLLKSS